jgi:MFS transporter, FSR family, fosmidomycin resistance protein
MKTPAYLSLLHILNDGFKASILLLLPFIAKEFRMTMTDVGTLGTAVNLLDVFLALPAGYYAAKIGGVRLLTYALLAYAAGFLLIGIAPSYVMVVGAFLAAGVGFGLFHPVSFAMVAKMHDTSKRGEKLGNFTALGDIGKIAISSFITFFITLYGWRNVSVACFASLVIFFVFSIKTLRRGGKMEINTVAISQDIQYRILLKNAKFRLAAMCFCIDTFASSSLFVFIPFLLLKRGVPPVLLGLVTSTFFFGNMFGKTILGRLADRFGSINIFIFSEVAMAIFIILLSNSTFLPIIIVSSVILGIFTKGTVPVLTTMISESTERHNNFEKAFGLNALITGVAGTIAPFVLGYLADKYGIVSAFTLSAAFAFLAIIPAILYKRAT